MSKLLTDEQLKQAVDQLFTKYDTDGSNTLERSELEKYIGQITKHMQHNPNITQYFVQNYLTQNDLNGDGKVSREQLYKIVGAINKS